MVEEIKKYTEQYDITYNVELKGDSSKFITLADAKNSQLPPVTIQYVKNEVHAIYFVNNQFFEISTDKLTLVLEAILKGGYSVVMSFLRKKKSIQIQDGAGYITPERIDDGAGIGYESSPQGFTIKE